MRLYKVEIQTNEGTHSRFFETYKEALRCRSSWEEEGQEDVDQQSHQAELVV